MNFFFTQVLFKVDGTFDRSTSGYETMDECEKAFHQGLVSAISKEDYTKAICFVFDVDGVIKFKRVWERG